jgi:lysosomal alpha-mannosidase
VFALDRSEGGSSIHDGSVEIMLHRRILHDDGLGVGEPLNEIAFGIGLVVRGKQFLILDSPTSSALFHRVASQQLFMHPLATYALPHLSYADYSANYRQTWSALVDDLPLNVHLLTFDQLDTKQYLIRVEHYFEKNEDETYSHPVIVDLQKIFETQGTINNIIEMTLGGNLALANLKRLEWQTDDKETSSGNVSVCISTKKISLFFSDTQSLQDTNITLNPMQIRTFHITLA